MNKFYSIVFVLFIVFVSYRISFVNAQMSENLPIAQTSPTPAAVTDADQAEKKEEEPSSDELLRKYKLVGIYLIGNEPRALIKNLENTDEGPKEYKQGDFIDEAQEFSLSKISFNPTSRVELIDQDGISYLIKPYSLDVKSLSGSPKGNFAIKKTPTYSSDTLKNKSKFSAVNKESSRSNDAAKEGNKTHGAESASSATGASPESDAKKDSATDSQKTAATNDSKETSQPQQEPSAQSTGESVQAAAMTTSSGETAPPQAIQKSDSAPTSGASMSAAEQQPTGAPSDTLDVSRPSNPFN